MKPGPSSPLRAEAPAAVEEVAAGILGSLAEPPVALYLFGSALTGGLRPDSDLDFLAVVRKPLPEAERRSLVRDLLILSGSSSAAKPGRPVELTVVRLTDVVPWRYPPRAHLVYGEWLRTELERGHIAPPRTDPDLTLVLATVLHDSLNLVGPRAPRLLDPVPFADIRRAISDSLPQLVQGVTDDQRNVILTLARMWTTLSSGEIVPKDVAAARMLEQAAAGQQAALELARRAYLGEVQDDWASLPGVVESFVQYALQEIRGLLADAHDPAVVNGSS